LAVCTNAYRDFGQKLQECLLSWNTDHLSFNQLLMDNKVVCSSVLIKKSVFQSTGGFPESKLFIAIEDYALWLKIAHLKDFSYLDLRENFQLGLFCARRYKKSKPKFA
jgi:hypothetical protein